MTEEELVEAARHIGDRGKRAAYLDRACAANAALRQRVEALLNTAATGEEGATGDVVPGHWIESADAVAQMEGPGARIGSYKLLQKIGEGGMGVVWMAEQQEPVRRTVALKLIKPGMDSGQVLARFEAERQALALMDHPHIAKVLDAGTTDKRRTYFVMELVKGVPITRFCDEHQLTPRQRLELFVPVCQAVQHAHQKGIIHRDLKPSNILVALYDDIPVPKVIDFGVAKATSQRLTERTMFTEFGSVIGTLEYMSPEQAKLNALDIDTRSDIYSLGVLLYELLTGTTPLSRKRLRESAFDEMLRVIREEEPPRPSTRVSTVETLPTIARQRNTEPAKLKKLLRGELDWIVMKALEKERTRRYETANGLARDLQRYLADEPVEACPPSASYRLWKFARKQRKLVAAVLGFTLLLTAGIGISTWQAVRATRAEHEADTARDEEARQRKEAVEQTARAEAALAAEQTARKHTREALDVLTDDVVEKLLARQAKLGPEEKAFLKKILSFYEEFTKDQGQSAEARALRAQGYHNVARLQMYLGNYAEAEAPLRQAESLLSQLIDEHPSVEAYQSLLASVWNRLSDYLENRGKNGDAQAMTRKSLAAVERLVVDHPEKPNYRHMVATESLNLGNRLRNEGQIDEAEKLYRRALTHLEAVTALPDAPAKAFLYLSSCHLNLGIICNLRGDPSAGEARMKRALAIRERLVNDFPNEPEHRVYLAHVHSGLAKSQLGQKKFAETEANFRMAKAIRAQLVADFPGVPRYQEYLAGQILDLGEFLLEHNQLEPALSEFDHALGAVSVAPAQDPWPRVFASLRGKASLGRARALDRLKRYADALAEWDRAIPLQSPKIRTNARLERAGTLARSGNHLEAVEEAAQFAGEPNATGPILYDSACVYSLSSAAAKDDAKLRERYAVLALELLTKARASGLFRDPTQIAHANKDSALDPLRGRGDFRKFIAELEKNQPAKGSGKEAGKGKDERK